MEEEKLSAGEEKTNLTEVNDEKKVIDIGDLITNSFKNFWRKFLVFVRLELFKVLVVVGIFVVFVVLAIVIGMISGNSLAGTSLGGLSIWATVAFAVLMVTMLVLIIIFGIWSEAAYAEIGTFYNERIGVIEAFKRSWPKASMYFWTRLAKELVIIGGLLLFVIPGIIFSIWFSFAEFVVMKKEASGVNALMLSKKYVGGRWWDVFLRVLLLMVLLIAIVLGLGTVEYIISFILGIISGVANNETFVLVIGIVSVIVSLIVRLIADIFSKGWSLIYRSFLYDNFKKIKGELGREISESKWWLYLVMIVFVFIIVGFFLLSGSLIALLNQYNTSGDLTNELNTIEEYSTSELTDSNLRASDYELQTTASNLSTALETYYTINGYYPFTSSLSNLWEGDNAVLDLEPFLPYQCGSLNEPSSECGIVYEWTSADSYTIDIDYILEDNEVIYGGEQDLTEPATEI